MSVDWLYFKWWRDKSGRTWIWHDCNGTERIEPLCTSIWPAGDGPPRPSIDCKACGKHTLATEADRCEPPVHWSDL